MNKPVLFALAMLVSTFSFSQKKELKAADKAINQSNYAEAIAALNQAESMMSAMDDKQKSQFNLLKSQALYANGTASDTDIDMAIEHLNKVSASNEEATEMRVSMENSLLTKANNSYKSQSFDKASSEFEQLYKVVPSDTTYLYYAAVSAVSDINSILPLNTPTSFNPHWSMTRLSSIHTLIPSSTWAEKR